MKNPNVKSTTSRPKSLLRSQGVRRVKDLMTRQVLTLTPEDSLRTLRDLIQAKQVRHVPITNTRGELVGLMTQRDFLTVAVSKFAHLDSHELDRIYEGIRIGDVMGRKVTATRPSTSLSAAAAVMYKRKFGCLPVLDGDQLVGILTEADFVKAFANQ